MDRVFCFCCKLFKQSGKTSQLDSEGCSTWHNISQKLKDHEKSDDHKRILNSWYELKNRLKKNETIDKSVQDQIIKDKEQWR